MNDRLPLPNSVGCFYSLFKCLIMRKLVLFYFLNFLFVLYAGAQPFAQRENTHRLMSYNIHHGQGMDGLMDVERIGRVILDVNAVVVALQEVDSVMNRSGNIDIMQLLALQTGMHASFGYSILHDGGKYGNGVLTREKPLSVIKISLPGADEARTALVVELSRYVVINTHLSLDNHERIESVRIITEFAGRFNKPVFLLGDLNANPSDEPIKTLEKEWQILSNSRDKTWPSDKPEETLDYVWGFKTNGETYAKFQSRVVNNNIGSDHRPIFVDVRLKTPATQVMRTIPYLQNPGTDQMTVMWITNVPARSWVEYGTDPDHLQRARMFLEGEMVANNLINSIELNNLKPGTKYYYRAVSQEITRYSSYYKEFGDTVKSELKSFTTWSNDITNFRVVVYNDIHSNMEMFRKLHDIVSQKPYDLVIFNGDCFDDVEVENDILSRLITYTPKIKSDEIPSIFIRGNHETRGEYSPLLWNYLGRMGGKSYSSFSMGDTRFVLLDCGEDKPNNHWVYYDMNDFTQHRLDQAEFLKTELKSKAFKKATKRVLIHHVPLFGKNLDEYTPCSDLWIPILEKAPFIVSLNAHTHTFELIEKGEGKNNFPVVIGGGNREQTGTVTVLEKTGSTLKLDVYNVKGEKIVERFL